MSRGNEAPTFTFFLGVVMRIIGVHAATIIVALGSGCAGPDATMPRLTTSVVRLDDRAQQPDASMKAHAFTAECRSTFNPPPLPLPPVHHQTDSGTCNFVPFGPMEFVSVQDINFAAGTQSGRQTFTARNGDQIVMVHSGRSVPAGPGLIHFTATMTILAGTGRFANATGFATAEGEANLLTNSTVSRREGWIARDK